VIDRFGNDIAAIPNNGRKRKLAIFGRCLGELDAPLHHS